MIFINFLNQAYEIETNVAKSVCPNLSTKTNKNIHANDLSVKPTSFFSCVAKLMFSNHRNVHLTTNNHIKKFIVMILRNKDLFLLKKYTLSSDETKCVAISTAISPVLSEIKQKLRKEVQQDPIKEMNDQT